MKMITMNFAVEATGYVPPRIRAVALSAKREFFFSGSKNLGSTINDAEEEFDDIFDED